MIKVAYITYILKKAVHRMIIHQRTNVYDFNFHLVWVTKYRKAVFINKVYQEEMKQLLLDIADHNNIIVEHLEVMPDHVHMLISFPPKVAPANMVKALKGASAYTWFQRHPETKKQLWRGHLWSPSYFISTIGNVSKEIVAQYIEDQMYKGKGRPRRDSSRH